MEKTTAEPANLREVYRKNWFYLIEVNILITT